MIKVAEYCLEHPGADETYPFGPDTTVMKTHGKVFAIMPAEAEPATISLKCDPIRARILRQDHPEISEGYHLNKTHWNTLDLKGGLSDELVRELIDHSFDLVKPKLKARGQL